MNNLIVVTTEGKSIECASMQYDFDGNEAEFQLKDFNGESIQLIPLSDIQQICQKDFIAK